LRRPISSCPTKAAIMGNVSAAAQSLARVSCAAPPQIDEKRQEIFDPEESRNLKVVIVGARGLPDAGWFPGEDRFLSCTLRSLSGDVRGSTQRGEDIFTTRRLKNVVDPIWREETYIPETTASLEFHVWKADSYGMSGLLASASLMSKHGELNFNRGFHGELPLQVQGDETADAYLAIRVQAEAEDYECPPFDGLESQFTASISNPTRKNLGIDMDSQGCETLLVTSVRAGPIMAYNSAVELEQQILPGHFVVSVNGVEGDATAMQREMQRKSRLEVVLGRPEDVRIAINVDSRRSLGIGIPRRQTGSSLAITQVRKGPVEDWNAENPWQKVQVGDRIVAVNGQRGKASDLARSLKAAMKIPRMQLTITRPIAFNPDEALLEPPMLY